MLFRLLMVMSFVMFFISCSSSADHENTSQDVLEEESFIENKEDILTSVDNNTSVITTQSRVIPKIEYSGEIDSIFSNDTAYAILKKDGQVFTYGTNDDGGDGYDVNLSNVKTIVPNVHAFAALKNDGSVVCWGQSNYGGNCKFVQARDLITGESYNTPPTNVKEIYANGSAYAAIRNDGTVVTWGDFSYGGSVDFNLTNVQTIISGPDTFAALTSDNLLVIWGNTKIKTLLNVKEVAYLGNGCFIALKYDGTVDSLGDINHYTLASNVKKIYTGTFWYEIDGEVGNTFTILKNDGSVSSIGFSTSKVEEIEMDLDLSDAKEVYSAGGIIAALKNDGSIVAWDNQKVLDFPLELSNIEKISLISTYSFIALKNDGNIVVFGNYSDNGSDFYIDAKEINISNVKQIYKAGNDFTVLTNEATLQFFTYKGLPVHSSYEFAKGIFDVKSVFSGENSFTILKNDGSFATWESFRREYKSGINPKEIETVSASQGAFAILKSDGSISTWGAIEYGGDSRVEDISNIKSIIAGYSGFLAVKTDGSVEALEYKGSLDGSALQTPTKNLLNVKNIVSARNIFAALKSDGSVVTWGGLESDINLTNVENLISNDFAFAALKSDGSVVTWGDSENGGDSSSLRILYNATSNNDVKQLLNIKALFPLTNNTNSIAAFIALKDDGSVLFWGNDTIYAFLSEKDFSNMKSLIATTVSYTMIKNDDSVISWGYTVEGVKNFGELNLSDIKIITTTDGAFAALKNDNSVVCWGSYTWGSEKYCDTSNLDLTDVKNITATNGAFAALKNNGSVTVWGLKEYGGDSSKVELTNVKSITATYGAFTALKNDGSIVTWGSNLYGGDSTYGGLTSK